MGRAQLGRGSCRPGCSSPRAGLARGWGDGAAWLCVCLTQQTAWACPQPDAEGFQERHGSKHPGRSRPCQAFAGVTFTDASVGQASAMTRADSSSGETDSTFWWDRQDIPTPGHPRGGDGRIGGRFDNRLQVVTAGICGFNSHQPGHRDSTKYHSIFLTQITNQFSWVIHYSLTQRDVGRRQTAS